MDITQKLISSVMSRTMCTVGVEQGAAEALALMQAKSVSSVLVTDDGLVLGIITERDVVRAWRRLGTLSAFSCADLMQSPVVSVGPQTRCLDAYHLMMSRGIRHLAVTDPNGRPLGMASEGDVMRNFGLEYYMNFKDVQSVMSTDFPRLAPTAPLAEALGQMADLRQSCVVVVDAAGKPTGMVTERDAVRLCRSDVSAEKVTVGEVMHFPVITVKPRRRLHTAVKAMEDKRIRRLVVVDDKGVAVGLLTHHEIARGLEGDYARYLQEIVELQARSIEASKEAIDEKLLLANILRSVRGTAVLASDLDYRISYATPSVAEVLGLDVRQVGGTDIRDTLRGTGWQEVTAQLSHDAISGGPRLYRVTTDYGPTEFQVSVLLNAQNDPQGYLVMAQRG
ncbi:MAG: CBS domain-containing protein [Burkholderiales bacterium]|nr:CBS domain-containing protein [Burkholderiales bacterium]